MDQIMYQRELLAFETKIDLAKLEAAKAQERVRELEYERSRFKEQVFIFQEETENMC